MDTVRATCPSGLFKRRMRRRAVWFTSTLVSIGSVKRSKTGAVVLTFTSDLLALLSSVALTIDSTCFCITCNSVVPCRWHVITSMQFLACIVQYLCLQSVWQFWCVRYGTWCQAAVGLRHYASVEPICIRTTYRTLHVDMQCLFDGCIKYLLKRLLMLQTGCVKSIYLCWKLA